MTATKRTGVRRIDDIDSGVIAWLHPGGADLDDVMLQIVQHMAADVWQPWVDIDFVPPATPRPRVPHADLDHPAWEEWRTAMTAWRAAGRNVIASEYTSDALWPRQAEVEVGWFRRFPWCHCGDGHAWHIESAGGPGPGASLAVLVSWW